jgi:hypothetical protein
VIVSVALLIVGLVGLAVIWVRNGVRAPRMSEGQWVTLHIRSWAADHGSWRLVQQVVDGEVVHVGRDGAVVMVDTTEYLVNFGLTRFTRRGYRTHIVVTNPHPSDYRGLQRYAQADYGGEVAR